MALSNPGHKAKGCLIRADAIWLLEHRTLPPLDNPFGTRVLTYVLETFCHLCVRMDKPINGSAGRIRTYDHSINSRTLYH